MVFRSKIDSWLAALLLLAACAPLLALASAIRDGTPWLPHAVLAVALAAFLLWLLLSTKYTVRDATVLVQSGPFRWTLAATGITRVVPSRSWVSGPALSLDRLQIDYAGGHRSLLVSPEDRDGFIQALEAARRAA